MEIPWVGRRIGLLVVLVAALLSGLVLAAGIEGDEADNGSIDLPASSESARAAEVVASLGDDGPGPALVVVDRPGGELGADGTRAVEELAADLGRGTRPVVADDGAAALLVVPLERRLSEDEQAAAIEELREAVSSGLPDGLRGQVTGGPAFLTDLSAVFDGADTRLLLVTACVVALLLLLTYRSPWLWLVPLTVVGVADQVAAKAVAAASQVLPFTTDGASVGITSVLVFGAGTNYALLLIARYREELRRVEDRYDAMRHALRRAAPAILASSGTVVLALLCLGLADNPGSRNIGFGGAIGIVVAVVAALVVLPAAMTLFGRRLFWPFVPRLGDDEPTRDGFWAGVARRVTARPVAVSLAAAAALALLAAPAIGLSVGLSDTEQFRDTPESVSGQEVLAAHFAAGSSQPTTVVTPDEELDAVRRAVTAVPGVVRVDDGATGDGATGDGTTVLEAVLAAGPGTDEAFAVVRDLRDAVGPDVLVGGPDAESSDAADAASRDQRLLIPLVLGVVMLVLLVLLRSVVAAVVLVLTVVATYLASLGASWVAFTQWFGFPALDLSVPLLAFLFLVALGVDYNIFLTTRAKEEAEDGAAPTQAISVALAVTGGVITSAGVLLASVFTVLGVLPLIVLTQIGVIVGFGVLLDTLVVRSVLVPALVALLGRWFWWPGPLSGRRSVSERSSRTHPAD